MPVAQPNANRQKSSPYAHCGSTNLAAGASVPQALELQFAQASASKGQSLADLDCTADGTSGGSKQQSDAQFLTSLFCCPITHVSHAFAFV